MARDKSSSKHTDAPRDAKSKSFRPDIQGLRAVAVVSVILDHLLGWPSGGFVGVDIFFVISGFLITGILLTEHSKTGRLSFVNFYRRRVKRIIPAAVLTLVITVVAAFIILNVGRAREVLVDAIWSGFFAGNWHFAAIGTDYFHAGDALSPLQHFWSLAVEEQFYLVWPWLMLLIFVLGARRKDWNDSVARRSVAIAMIVIVVASFAWAMWESAQNPTWAYFSTFSRAWELGIGALIAVLAPIFTGLPAWARAFLGWVGLAGILASLFVINSTSTFPAPWGAIPVVSAALVIIAGTGGPQRTLVPLTNPVMGYLGQISYSLYLWHFPVIVLLAALIAPATPIYYGASVILILFLANASYYLVEEPVRRSLWLSGIPRDRIKDRRRQRQRSGVVLVSRPALLIFLALVSVSLVGFALYASSARHPGSAIAAPIASVSADPDDSSSAALTTNTNALKVALAATEWPTLNPSVENLGQKGWVSEWITDDCLDISESNVDRCVYGNTSGSKLAVVIGDSDAISYMPGIRAALDNDWKIQTLTLEQCPSSSVTVTIGSSGAPYPACDQHRDWALNWISQHKPDLVIATDAITTIERVADGSSDAQRLTAFKNGTAKTMTALSASAKKVVLLAAPPNGKSLQDCRTNFSKPSDCSSRIGARYVSVTGAQKSGVDQANAANVTYAKTTSWFCVSSVCPSFVESVPMFADGSHLTGPSSARLGPLLADVLDPPVAAAG